MRYFWCPHNIVLTYVTSWSLFSYAIIKHSLNGIIFMPLVD